MQRVFNVHHGKKNNHGVPDMLGTHRRKMHPHHLLPAYLLLGLLHGVARDDLPTVSA